MRRKGPKKFDGGEDRYDDGFAKSFGLAMKEAMEAEARGEETSFGRDRSHEMLSLPKPTNEERLQYYRAHGLTDCADYPGGDAQFEADVLSGLYHDEQVEEGEPKREDAYVIQAMWDGRLRYDGKFKWYIHHPLLRYAYYCNSGKNGFHELRNWQYRGGPYQYMQDLLSGEYARKCVAEREKKEE